jgi:spermidine synthase
LGITLAATVRNPAVDSVQVIELSREMVEAHKYLHEVDGGVLDSPKVSVRIDDGRNFFAMTDRRFDMITADPIHPRITGVGYLYTEQYYYSIKQRLKPGGVVCQWMPMYNISKQSFDVAFRTFAHVFRNASFWYVRGHGLFVATQSSFKIDFADLSKRIAEHPVADDMASIDIYNAEDFTSYLLMGPRQIQQYLAASSDDTLNTDSNAYLEYHTPSEFLYKTRDIVQDLVKYAGYDSAIIQNASPEQLDMIRAEWQRRQARLLPELDEPLR